MRAQRPPLFLADAMLSKLARWLRLLGVPTLYAPSELSDEEVLRLALRERAVLLTRDKALYAHAKDHVPALLFTGTDTRAQLRELFQTYGLRVQGFLARTRCPACGEPLERVRKGDVKGLVYPAVYASQHRFWKCPGCGKVYWQGAHWKKISREVSALTRGLGARRARPPSALSRRPAARRRRA